MGQPNKHKIDKLYKLTKKLDKVDTVLKNKVDHLNYEFEFLTNLSVNSLDNLNQISKNLGK